VEIPIGGEGGYLPTSGFVVETMPQRIVFGAGSIVTVAAEVSRADLKRVLVIASGSSGAIAEQIVAELGSSAAGRLSEVRQHVPRPLAEEACREAIATEADGLVAVGGGSSIGLAKAVAVQLGLSIVAVPVTYSGSEVSSIYGITDERKHTAKDPRALPRVVIYDPELGSALSSQVTAASGFNALAHAVEALYSSGRNPTSSLQAAEAIRLLAGALRVLVERSDDVRRRAEALLGAYLAGSATATAGTALQHKLAHVLGGTHDLTHAELHAVLLPHVTAYNQPASGDLLDGAAAALDAPDTATGLWRLGRQIGNPTSLAELGLDKEVLDEAAEQTVIEVGAANPRPVDRRAVMALLEDAYAGRTPPTNEEDGDG
jgi:maleylacetate reductase